MRFWNYSILACTLALAGCHDSDTKTAFVIEKPATARPIVAVVPVMDQSHHDLKWNISDLLTLGIRQRLASHNMLYLIDKDQVYAMTQKGLRDRDPFGEDIAWVRKAYPQNEFVAFFELSKHREIPLLKAEEPHEDCPAELTIALRVRVFDLRGDSPKVVLQEIIEQSHHIPQQFTKNQGAQVAWGSETFDISPLGLAHEKLCQEVASRVEDYIMLNCK